MKVKIRDVGGVVDALEAFRDVINLVVANRDAGLLLIAAVAVAVEVEGIVGDVLKRVVLEDEIPVDRISASDSVSEMNPLNREITNTPRSSSVIPAISTTCPGAAASVTLPDGSRPERRGSGHVPPLRHTVDPGAAL